MNRIEALTILKDALERIHSRERYERHAISIECPGCETRGTAVVRYDTLEAKYLPFTCPECSFTTFFSNDGFPIPHSGTVS